MLGLLGLGLLLGAIVLAGFAAFVESTSTLSFCTSCHEMRVFVFEEYKKSPHYRNASGVRAICADCHVPHPPHLKLLRKIKATVTEVPAHLLGRIDTTVANFRYTGRLTDRLSLTASYRYDDRDRDQGSVLLTWTPSQYWSLGLDVSYSRDDFENSEFGLTDSRLRAYTLDFNANPFRDWTTYAFFTHEELDFDQNGVSFQFGPNRVNQVVDPARFWQALHRERIDTASLGVAWKPREGRFSFGLDLLGSLSKADVEVSTGAALSSAPLPSNRVRLNSATLYGTYAVNDNLALRGSVWHERYRSEDIALDVPAKQLANVILFGEEAADFDVTAIGLSVIYKF